METRAGRRLEHMARHRWRSYARQNWTILLRASLIVALWTALGLIPALLVYGAFGRGVALGSLGTLTVGFLVWIVAEESGAIRAKHGAAGEQLTARELGRLQRHGWHVRHDLLFDRFNVDHVLVGPGGVVAVETKSTSGHWDFTAARLDPLAAKALQQARAAARKTRLLLSSTGVDAVEPMLICWGPNVADLPEGWLIINDVVVVVGRQAREALPAALGRSQSLTLWTLEDVLRYLDDFIGRRDRYERQRGRANTARPFRASRRLSA